MTSHSSSRRRVASVAVAAVLAMVLSGCAQTHLSKDFGVAIHQNLAAQVADPDAQYKGDPAPGSDGSRVGLAQSRYVKGETLQPSTAGAAVDVGSESSTGGGQ
ncbi:MAG: hypothetical protein ABWZ40_03470 [Caulobacterales bacterium]